MRVLLLSTTTGYQLRSFGEAAERLGVELTLATDRCHQLDDPWQDAAIPVRFHDEEGSLDAIRAAAAERPFSGVISVGDRPAVLASRVAQLLRLPGNPPDAAEATRNKKLMRRKLASAGLPVPWFVELRAGADVHDAAGRVRYPCIVKPLGLSGSRGVIRADTPPQLEYAVARARALLARPDVRAFRSGLEAELLIEGYIEGCEYAVEGLVTRGDLRVLAIFDKPDRLDGPFFEETIYVTPTDVSRQVRHAIADQVQRATAALGLMHGPIHAECRVGPGGVVMLEVAARPIGGLCSKVLRFMAGRKSASLEDLLLRHVLGEDVSQYVREDTASGVMMIPIPKRGLFKSVWGEESAREVAHVDDVRITAKRDQLLEPLPEGDSYLGFIFARASEASDVVAALRESHRRLSFRIDPELRVATVFVSYLLCWGT
ncbi:MAG: ATP-grasp domain-containing protein [Acidobacteria bacterium]|nr:ATP-grasp domain-containing protein [Acidobacteriota bacterium]